MEGVQRRDNHRLLHLPHTVRILPRELDGGLIGLGAAVAEEDLVGTGIRHQPRGQLSLLGDEVQVRAVMQLAYTRKVGR